MALYASLDYWERRYKFKNEQYEWFVPYEALQHLLTPQLLSPADGVSTSKPRRTIEVRDNHGNLVPRSVVDLSRRTTTSGKPFPLRAQCRVLIVGCGNSRLAEDMMMDGWTGGIVNVDFSSTVIDQMNQRYNSDFYDRLNAGKSLSITTQPLEFLQADVTRKLPFTDGSFDLVVLKGTLDSILCSPGSVANARRTMEEVSRVLRDEHGAMVVVSHGNSDSRLVFFENEGDEWWDGTCVHTISRPNDNDDKRMMSPPPQQGNSKEYYVYISRKRARAADQMARAREAHKNASRVAISGENDPQLLNKSSSSGNGNKSGSVGKSVAKAVASVAGRAQFTKLLR